MGIEKFIKSVCVQTALYWSKPVADGFGGMTFANPIELTPPDTGVRWAEKTQVVSDGKGKEIVSKAEILTPNDLEEEGWLWLGSLNDVPAELVAEAGDDPLDPRKFADAYEIKRTDRIPLFKATDRFVRTVYL